MSIFNNFSYKLFGVVTALFYCAGVGYAMADAVPPGILISLDRFNNEPQTLCVSGYYLSSCNHVQIGTNWLKGISGTIETPDYYSYESPDFDNMTNLRKFFAGIEQISYTAEDSGKTVTVDPTGDSGYVKHRNTILNTFCTNGNGELKNIECKKCPNGANVSESTVNIGKYPQKILNNSWKIHTIADCYMDEFSDHTGTYVYVRNDDVGATGQRCYYSNTVKGDVLVSE